MLFKSVSVFCSNFPEVPDNFRQASQDLAEGIAKRGITIIYGGRTPGLMGVIADAAMAAGGKVIGVAPVGMSAAHQGLTELISVPDLRARKAKMLELAEATLVLPGGVGTLDETFDILALHKIGAHAKPVYFVNLFGFWDPLIQQFQAMVDCGISPANDMTFFTVVPGVAAMLDILDGQ